MAVSARSRASVEAPTPSRPQLKRVEPFVMLRKSMLYDTRVDPLRKVLYLIIVDQAWEGGGECQLSHAELASMIGRTPRTLQTLLSGLIEDGLIGSRRLGQTQAKAYWPLSPDELAEPSDRHTKNIAGVKPHRQPIAGVEDAHQKKISPTPEENFHPHQKNIAGAFLLDKTGTGEPENPAGSTLPEIAAPTAAPQPAPEAVSSGENSSRPSGQTPGQAAVGRLKELIAEQGVPLTFTGRDGSLLKTSGADPEEVAEAYCALYRGEWDDTFLRRRLSVHAVIENLAAYHVRSAAPPRSSGRQGETWTGGIGHPHSVEASIHARDWPEAP